MLHLNFLFFACSFVETLWPGLFTFAFKIMQWVLQKKATLICKTTGELHACPDYGSPFSKHTPKGGLVDGECGDNLVSTLRLHHKSTHKSWSFYFNDTFWRDTTLRMGSQQDNNYKSPWQKVFIFGFGWFQCCSVGGGGVLVMVMLTRWLLLWSNWIVPF